MNIFKVAIIIGFIIMNIVYAFAFVRCISVQFYIGSFIAALFFFVEAFFFKNGFFKEV